MSGDRTKERLRSGLLRRLQAARDEEVGFMDCDASLAPPSCLGWSAR